MFDVPICEKQAVVDIWPLFAIFLALIKQLAQEKRDAGFDPSAQCAQGKTVGKSSIYVKVSQADIDKMQREALART